MLIRPHPTPYKFMPSFERFEPEILDSHAMQTMKACLRKYFFQIVIGANPNGPPAPYFAFGSAYHKFREVLEIYYAKAETKGMSLKAVEDAQNICFMLARKAGQDYLKAARDGKEVPVGTKWDFLTEARLLKSCDKAFEHWKREKTNNKITVLAVEQPFNVKMGPDTDEHTSGRFDQIIRWNGKVYGRDFKTSSKEGAFYERTLDPNDQFTRYTFAEQELAGQRVEGQIIEVLYNSKKKGPELSQYVSNRSQWQLDDWQRDELFHRETLNRARALDQWPKQETNCSFCVFHSVCQKPNEGSQVAKLKAEFTFKPWDNMTVHLLDDEK